MVVLESKGMLTAGSNQYLQPDYLSPLPTTLDAKKSPLALLAQTCSQIGADSSKPLPNEKKKEEEKKEKSTPTPIDATRRSPAFKPYESATKKNMAEETTSSEEKGHDRKTPSSQPSSARSPSNSSNGGGSSSGTTKEESGRRSSEAGATSSASTTPIIRSGLEVLAGHPKDVPLGTYRTGVPPMLSHGYPGLESHPALRGAHPGFMQGLGLPGLPSSLASVYPSAAAAALYSSAGLTSTTGLPPSLLASPYLTYTRVKTAGGGEAVVPVCRDPYCTGCPYSVQNNHLLQSGGACPPSCTQCEQAKAALSALPGLSSLPPSSLVPASSILPPTSVAAAAAASLYSPSAASSLLTGPPRPYVCNWIAGDTYCGKRFSTSEELLQHLRTHTNMSTDSSSLSLLSNPLHAHAALLGSAHSALHRPGMPYPPPALSPLTAARYHPYSKPSALSTSAALTPTLPGLSPYASALSAYPHGYPSPYAGLYPRPPL
ncbi:zinc finger protein Noc-like [Macrobrachium nipponense]|uniref:zinc finger protein Noc-like n=1 Tax=Macrobrachium nipponense TaxID=159736 RepID=UPI0030C7C035